MRVSCKTDLRKRHMHTLNLLKFSLLVCIIHLLTGHQLQPAYLYAGISGVDEFKKADDDSFKKKSGFFSSPIPFDYRADTILKPISLRKSALSGIKSVFRDHRLLKSIASVLPDDNGHSSSLRIDHQEPYQFPEVPEFSKADINLAHKELPGLLVYGRVWDPLRVEHSFSPGSRLSLWLEKRTADPFEITLSHSFKKLSSENKTFLRTGFKDYLNGLKEFNVGRCRFRLERLSVHGNLFVSSGRIMLGSYLEAKSNAYLDMRSLHLQGDLKVTIIKVPLVKQIRLFSRHYSFSSPRRDLHDPGLERGFKLAISDFDLGARRFYSFLELQIPPLLGQRGIVGSIFLNQFNGIGLNIFFDLPNIRFKGSPLKLRLPNYEYKSDK